MDLNDLLHRHQVALMRVANVKSVEAAHSHGGIARCYEKQIASLRDLLGASGRMVTA